MTKQCKSCLKELPISEFGTTTNFCGNKYTRNTCKSCANKKYRSKKVNGFLMLSNGVEVLNNAVGGYLCDSSYTQWEVK